MSRRSGTKRQRYFRHVSEGVRQARIQDRKRTQLIGKLMSGEPEPGHARERLNELVSVIRGGKRFIPNDRSINT